MLKARLSNAKLPLSWPKHFPSKESSLSLDSAQPEREPSAKKKLLPLPNRASDAGFDATSLGKFAGQHGFFAA